MVNSVGGIDVTISSSDPRGLYDKSKDYTTGGVLVKLKNGLQHLNGQSALNLARARGDAPGSYGFANSDFTRTANQRLMLLSLKKKIFSSGVVANPVKLSKLSDAIGNNVKSDMKLSEVRRLYDLTKKVNNSQIKSYGLNDIKGQTYLKSFRNNRGQDTLIPEAGLDDYSDIKLALRQVMSNNPVVREGANVVLLNATDTSGLAAKFEEILVNKNVLISQIADAHKNLNKTQIIITAKGNVPKTVELLNSTFVNSEQTSVNDYANRFPKADVIVLIGADQIQAHNSSQ